MTLPSQLTSLKISERLKELGVKQESLFWGVEPIVGSYNILLENNFDKKESEKKGRVFCSAFSVAELGEMLPKSIDDYGIQIEYREKNKEWKVGYVDCVRNNLRTKEGTFVCEFSSTEADARGAMLIYLIEQGLIKI